MNKTKLIAIVGLVAGISFSSVAFGMRKGALKKHFGTDNSPKKRSRRPEQPSRIFIQTGPEKFNEMDKPVKKLEGSFRIIPTKVSENETVRLVEFEKYDEQ